MPNIDETATVIDCSISNSARVYRFANLKRTSMEDDSIIADFCKVEDSHLAAMSHLYANGMMYGSELGAFSYVQKNASIWHATIGKFCSISWNVSIGGGEHDFTKVTSHSLLYVPSYGFVDEPHYDRFAAECRIGNDVWIGAGAQVLRGVTVGDGAVIGAGAVVTHDVEPYSINVGMPARIVGQRCDDALIGQLLDLRWWDLDITTLRRNANLLSRQLSQETVRLLWEMKS